MSLSKSKLESEFRKVMDATDPNFVGWPNTILAGVNNFVTAYENYAKDAVDHSLDSLLVYNKAGFISALSGLTNNETYASAAAAMEAGFSAFWLASTFQTLLFLPGFASEATSIVTVVTPNVLYPLLLTEFTKIEQADMGSKISRLADIFHTATTTAVIVTIAGTTPPPPGPIGDIFNIS